MAGLFVAGELGLGLEESNASSEGPSRAESLLERIRDSFQPAARRSAAHALAQLLSDDADAQLAVGQFGMPVFFQVLREDSEDNELVAASLKALCATVSDNLTSPSSSSASARTGGRSPGPLCSDALANDSRSTLLVLSLLHHSDFYVKFYATRVLSAIAESSTRALQAVVLEDPTGVGRIMDILNEAEALRNEGIILLRNMTRRPGEVMKVFAFEGAFDKVLGIVQDETIEKGGALVNDCLRLLVNMLENNESNQKFFRESSFIPRLVGLLQQHAHGSHRHNKTDPQLRQDERNEICLMESLCCLLALASQREGNQSAMVTNDAVEALASFSLEHDLSAFSRSSALRTLAALLPGSREAQERLNRCRVSAHGKRKSPALNVILLHALYSKHSIERFTAADVIHMQCVDNEVSTKDIVESMAMPQADTQAFPEDVLFGEQLTAGLSGKVQTALVEDDSANVDSSDIVSRASWVLSGILERSTSAKEMALQVNIDDSNHRGGAPHRLLHSVWSTASCMDHDQHEKAPSLYSTKWLRSCILKLIVCWALECAPASKEFLRPAGSLPSAVQLANSNDSLGSEIACALLGILLLEIREGDVHGISAHTLLDTINNQIGLSKLFDRWESLEQHASSDKLYSEPIDPGQDVAQRPITTNYTSPQSLEREPLMHADLATRLNSIRQRVRQHALELFAQPRNGCGPTNYTELEQGKEESISNYADRLKGLLRAKEAELESIRSKSESLAAKAMKDEEREDDVAKQGHEATTISQVESELRAELQRLQSEKSQLDENLSSLSEAYNALERDYNDLQSTRKNEASKNLSEVQTAYNRGVQEGKAETESAVEKAKEEANEQNQANIDDLFACLGEEEAKVERLKSRLEQIGEDPEPLLQPAEGEQR